MNKTSQLNTGPASVASGPFRNVEDAVAALTPNINQLARIAERLLTRLASQRPGQRLRALRDPMDIVHDAIGLVLEGAAHPGSGRKTDSNDLESLKAFLNHVQGVIQSHVWSLYKSVKREGSHLSLGSAHADACEVVDPQAPQDVTRDVSLSETRRELFRQLRNSFKEKPSVMPVLANWEQHWPECDRIPKGDLTNKQIFEVRDRARRILDQMAVSDGLSQDEGHQFFRG